MSTLAIKYFDTHKYVKKSKDLGSSEELAEYQVAEFERAIETAIDSVRNEMGSKELATKHDINIVKYDISIVRKDIDLVKLELQKEIVSSKNQMILWIAGLLFTNGLIQHFFK